MMIMDLGKWIEVKDFDNGDANRFYSPFYFYFSSWKTQINDVLFFKPTLFCHSVKVQGRLV
jgi:hypothetical protein